MSRMSDDPAWGGRTAPPPPPPPTRPPGLPEAAHVTRDRSVARFLDALTALAEKAGELLEQVLANEKADAEEHAERRDRLRQRP